MKLFGDGVGRDPGLREHASGKVKCSSVGAIQQTNSLIQDTKKTYRRHQAYNLQDHKGYIAYKLTDYEA